jgi:hypothetical protein
MIVNFLQIETQNVIIQSQMFEEQTLSADFKVYALSACCFVDLVKNGVPILFDFLNELDDMAV